MATGHVRDLILSRLQQLLSITNHVWYQSIHHEGGGSVGEARHEAYLPARRRYSAAVVILNYAILLCIETVVCTYL